jgi:phosphoglycolate phosphatase
MIEQAMDEVGAKPRETVMIGDTSYDMLMARAAGVRGIGVAWGYHEAAELLESGADIVLERFEALPPLLLERTAAAA